MGRHRKYATIEEAKQAQRANVDKVHRMKLAQKGRNAVQKPCKHKRLYVDCIRIDIGTMDRTKLDTAYVEMFVTTTYTNDEEIIKMYERNIKDTFKKWLNDQDMWDRLHKICVVEYAAIRKSYKGTAKSFTIQLHVRRDQDNITDWKDTYTDLMGLVDTMVDTIKRTCVETGLQLRKWSDINGSSSRSKLATSEASEPESSSSLLVEV